MRRGVVLAASGMFALGLYLASQLASAAAVTEAGRPAVLERFLAGEKASPPYRALRRLDALNDRQQTMAWMDVWTEVDAAGFRYEIAAQGGSGYVRSRVFTAALEAERGVWAAGTGHRVAITPDNYLFEDRGAEASGLAWLGVIPRRKEFMLVHGSIFLRPDTGDLVRIQGALAKPPSFWIRRVDIDRRYERVGGVRMPVSLESVARVLIAGTSIFTVAYDYETVNGQHVGSPTPRQPPSVDSPGSTAERARPAL